MITRWGRCGFPGEKIAEESVCIDVNVPEEHRAGLLLAASHLLALPLSPEALPQRGLRDEHEDETDRQHQRDRVRDEVPQERAHVAPRTDYRAPVDGEAFCAFTVVSCA